jgi:acyl-CoA hydrolase/RimJ/RimL family protein N-acetyltransferase
MATNRKICRKISYEALFDLIRPGDRIFISSGPATPIKTITKIMESEHSNLYDLEIIQLVLPEMRFIMTDDHPHKYRWKTFNVGAAISHGFQKDKVDFIPSNFSEIPYLFHSDALDVKIAIIQTSPPDDMGFMSLGVVADVADLVLKNVPIAIAEFNPNVPLTHGETSVHLNQFDYFTESDEPLLDKIIPEPDDIANRIGWHVGNIIEDNSTVSLNFGSIFTAIADRLKTKRNIRICSHTVSDWVIDLIGSGALILDRGIEHQGIIMTSACFGSQKLYNYVNNNPFFDFAPLMRASYQKAMPKIPSLVSIINAQRVDITGNAVALNRGDCFLPGFEGKLNFAMASALSRNGKSIVTARALDHQGNSNIVIFHNGHEHVRSTLGTTRYVVTEYGVANIAGKSIRERALAIIDIAHPGHRDNLIRQAKEAGYIYGDQIYMTKYAADYPFFMETVKTFSKNQEIKFRPIKPSDEDMMRRLFYGFSDKSKYLRYFTPIRFMPHDKMQPYVNIDYNNILSIVGTIQHKGKERIVAEGRYSYDDQRNQYEMAFVVDDEFQGMGIAKFMLDYLISIARERGIDKLYAVTMSQNEKMAKVFLSTKPKPQIMETDEDEVEYVFELENP